MGLLLLFLYYHRGGSHMESAYACLHTTDGCGHGALLSRTLSRGRALVILFYSMADTFEPFADDVLFPVRPLFPCTRILGTSLAVEKVGTVLQRSRSLRGGWYYRHIA